MELVAGKLSNDDLTELASKVQTLNQNRITYDEILAREYYFMSLNATNILDAVKARFSPRTRGLVEKTRESHNKLRAQIEIAAATMAMIRYTRENTTGLTNVESLAPKYLRTIPIDPFSNQPLLVFVSSTNAPIVYSVGPNRRDDQGTSDDIVSGQRDNTWFRALSNAMSPQ